MDIQGNHSSHQQPLWQPPRADQKAPTATAPHTGRARHGGIVALGVLGAVVIGAGSVAGAFTIASVASHVSAIAAANAQRSQLEQALYGSSHSHSSNGSSSGSGSSGSEGSGSGSSGSGSSGSGTGTAAGTTATSAQATGIVLINTQLSYQGAAAAGTGMVLSSGGEILTNNHVVAGSTSISVTIASTGKSYNASVAGTDATDDVAVLRLSGASGLTPASIDTSASPGVGDSVTGVGNAGGTGTLTAAAGSVTALGQSITTQAEGAAASETLSGLIQTDADIQAGDSGGPLYDSNGGIVGIDTAASVGSSQNQGYAIPIADALKIASQIDSGQASDTVSIGYPAFLGIEVGATDQSGAGGQGGYGSLGGSSTSTNSGQTAAGAPVAGVIASGPAAGAGIVAGDTITAVDGTAISSAAALTSTLAGYQPGHSVTITWSDASGTSQSATVTLATGPAA